LLQLDSQVANLPDGDQFRDGRRAAAARCVGSEASTVAKSTASFAYELPSRAMPERLDVSTVPVPVLHGPNVTLRRAVSEDVQARLALGRDPGIFEMFGVSRDAIKPMSREDAELGCSG
jgi:hypothetical protein